MQSNSSDNCIHRYNVEVFNIFDPELQLTNTTPMIKNKSKELLSKLKKFKVQAVLVLDYKKRNDRKIFHKIFRKAFIKSLLQRTRFKLVCNT